MSPRRPASQYPHVAARDATVFQSRIYHLTMVGATPHLELESIRGD